MAQVFKPNTRRDAALRNARWEIATAIHILELELGFRDAQLILQPLAIAIQEIDNRRHAVAESVIAGERE